MPPAPPPQIPFGLTLIRINGSSDVGRFYDLDLRGTGITLEDLGVGKARISFPVGGAFPGFPNAIGFFNPAGTALISNAGLTAAPVDPFGRPQIRDIRTGGAGAVWRQGAWQSDGDATNVVGDGIVLYGPNSNGVQSAAEGGYNRQKPNRVGFAQIITGVNGDALFYAFRADYDHVFVTDDLAATIAETVRKGVNAGLSWFSRVRFGSLAGPQISGTPDNLIVTTKASLNDRLADFQLLSGEEEGTSADAVQFTLATLAIPAGRLWNLKLSVTALKDDMSVRGYWDITVRGYNVGGVATLEAGFPVVNPTTTGGTLDATVTAVGGDFLVRCTGIAATTVEWGVEYHAQEQAA